jgi:hypothetical protein
LLARGILYTPAGGTRFEQGEAVRVYVEVYDPRLLTGMPEIKLGLIVTNSKTGGQVAQAEFGNVANLARPGTDLIPLGFTVPAQPAGEYRIELRAAGAGHTASRVMDFEVE